MSDKWDREIIPKDKAFSVLYWKERSEKAERALAAAQTELKRGASYMRHLIIDGAHPQHCSKCYGAKKWAKNKWPTGKL